MMLPSWTELVRYFKAHRVLAGLLAMLVSALLLASLAITSYQRINSNTELKLGVSFSARYAEELGLDWQAAYQAILSELEIKHLRLMSYWNSHEPRPGEYNFDALDYQMSLAAQYDAQVNLAVGLRQPRWPECHPPDWLASLDAEAQQQALLRYLEVVVSRYKDHPALAGWHLENEASNNNFGTCPRYDRQLLAKEIGLVKQLDSKHPVITTSGNQAGLPVRGPVGDKVGFSIYRQIYGHLGPLRYYWSHWYLPAGWHSLRAALVNQLHSRPVIVHELQAEPWGPRPITELSSAEQARSMTAAQIARNLHFAERTGIAEIYLWGAEWWYWRKVVHADSGAWEIVQRFNHNY
jgi:hypothetical protein